MLKLSLLILWRLRLQKTAQGKEILKALAQATTLTQLVTKRKNTAVLVLPGRDIVAEKSFRNLGNIEVIQAKDVNPVDLLTYKYVLMVEPATTIEILSKRVVGTAVTTKK